MFIDIHVHAYSRPQPYDGQVWFSTPEQVLRRHDELDIETGCLLPLVSPEVYFPQSNEEILAMCAAHPGRFIPFCNIDPRAITNSPDAPLGDILRYYRDLGCRGIGEVMPNLPFLDPLVQNLFQHVEAVGFPLIFDSATRIGGRYGLFDEAGLPQLETCLQRFPALTILGHGPPFWAEIAQLESPEDRAGYPKYPVKEQGAAVRLLRQYPNLLGDLSAGSGYNALARDRHHAAAFLEEFQDKLLFGTDLCRPDGDLPLAGFLTDLRREGKLSNDAFRKIARDNAVQLLKLQPSSPE